MIIRAKSKSSLSLRNKNFATIGDDKGKYLKAAICCVKEERRMTPVPSNSSTGSIACTKTLKPQVICSEIVLFLGPRSCDGTMANKKFVRTVLQVPPLPQTLHRPSSQTLRFHRSSTASRKPCLNPQFSSFSSPR